MQLCVCEGLCVCVSLLDLDLLVLSCILKLPYLWTLFSQTLNSFCFASPSWICCFLQPHLKVSTHFNETIVYSAKIEISRKMSRQIT